MKPIPDRGALALPVPVARVGIVASLAFLLLAMSVPVIAARGAPRHILAESPYAHSARVHREPVLRVAHADALLATLQRWGWSERQGIGRR